jgi:hypothetical protein
MAPPVRRDEAKLLAVGSTLLHLCDQLGLYHYNKLVYLFEYFHIKNFGSRFTKEVFSKFPHGPVIVGYKQHIETLVRSGMASADIEQLHEKRDVDDIIYPKFLIESTEQTTEHVLGDPLLYDFARALCQKFAPMSVTELESFVYSTKPLIAFQKSPFKKETGGYILTGDCIKLKDHLGPLQRGRAMLKKHLEEYPTSDYEQQKRFAEEFGWMSGMRPGG